MCIRDRREIGTYVDWEKMVESYTTGVTGKDVFELLTGAVIDDNTVLRYVDGGLDKTFDEDAVLLRSNRNDLADTGKGALTEVYLDTDQDEIRIVTVNTWLAQATSDYNTSSELATVKIFDKYNADTMVTGSSTQSVDAEVVPAVAELKKDDYVLVNQSIKDRTKLEVVAIAEPELLEDCTVTAFSKTKEDQSSAFGADAKGLYESVTTSGEKYDGAVKAYYEDVYKRQTMCCSRIGCISPCSRSPSRISCAGRWMRRDRGRSVSSICGTISSSVSCSGMTGSMSPASPASRLWRWGSTLRSFCPKSGCPQRFCRRERRTSMKFSSPGSCTARGPRRRELPCSLPGRLG